MTRVVRSARTFVRGPKRRTIWIQFQPAITTMSATGGTLIFSLNATALALRPFTIVRTHLDLLYLSDQEAASESLAGVYGRTIVTDRASGAGIASVPTPLTNTDENWFAYQAVSNDFIRTAAGLDGNNGTHYTIDSKAMRKVGPNDDVIAVFEQQSATGAVIVANGRYLVKLH